MGEANMGQESYADRDAKLAKVAEAANRDRDERATKTAETDDKNFNEGKIAKPENPLKDAKAEDFEDWSKKLN